MDKMDHQPLHGNAETDHVPEYVGQFDLSLLVGCDSCSAGWTLNVEPSGVFERKEVNTYKNDHHH
jgi:hypothetical protein